MGLWLEWWRRLRGQRERERGLADEIAFHIEEEIASNVRRGMPPDEARRAALLRFGGVERVKELTRDQFQPVQLHDLWRDLRLAARTLRRAPGFSLVAVLTLALAIGANTAIFGIVHGILLRPLPFEAPGQIVRVLSATKDSPRGNYSAADFLDLRDRNQSLAAMAGFRGELMSVSIRPGEPQQLEAQHVTAGFFDVLGASAALGRTFSPSDRGVGERLVVLSDAGWNELFGRSRAVTAQSLRLNGQSYRIAGVMPPAFAWPEGTKVWVLSPKPVPPSPIDGGDELSSRDIRYFEVVARLKAGVSFETAAADVHRVAVMIASEHPASAVGRDMRLLSLREEIVGDVRPALLLLEAAVAIVLLVASANVSGLLIARATGRRRELAIRAAIGATRWHLVRMLLAESLLLGVAGGACGLLVGGWVLQLWRRMLPEGIPRVEAIGFNATVAAVMLTASVLTSVLFGLLPAWQASRANAGTALVPQGVRVAAGRARGRSALIVGEIALTLVLLVGAALLGSSFLRLSHVDSGFRAEQAVVAELILPHTRYATGDTCAALYRRLIDALSEQSGVEAAGIGYPGPLRGTNASATLVVEEQRGAAGHGRAFAYIGSVSGGYFQAMGVPLLAGRTFTATDQKTAEGVAIANAALAREYWPGQNAIGKRLSFDDSGKGPWVTIVGIVADVRHIGLRTAPPAVLYIPYTQFSLPFTNVVIRSARSVSDVAVMMRSVLATIDPDLPLGSITPLQESIDQTIGQTRFRTIAVGVFAALTLALALVGVYGLISFSVSERTNEIGIRMALGAAPHQVVLPLLSEGVRVTGLGVAAGSLLSLGMTRLLSDFLFDVSATDPATFAVVALLVIGAALLACYMPSRRAARVDPVIALRKE